MMQVTEHRTRARGLADLLLYHALVDDGILLQQDGSLLAAWRYRGPDTMSSSDAEVAALSARLNSVLRLGSGWMVQCDAIRSQAPGYPDTGTFPDIVTRVIDDERRQQFTAEGAHYESEYFLTLTYLPPVEAEEKIKGWMFEGHTHRSEPARLVLDRFKSRLEAFENVLGQIFRIERLSRDAGAISYGQDRLLRYIHRCLTGNDHPIAVPEIPIHLNDLLSSEDFCGGIAPRIGEKYIHVIAIDGLPRTSSPGILAWAFARLLGLRFHLPELNVGSLFALPDLPTVLGSLLVGHPPWIFVAF
jgi:type IV secretion system protein VirB4